MVAVWLTTYAKRFHKLAELHKPSRCLLLTIYHLLIEFLCIAISVSRKSLHVSQNPQQAYLKNYDTTFFLDISALKFIFQKYLRLYLVIDILSFLIY